MPSVVINAGSLIAPAPSGRDTYCPIKRFTHSIRKKGPSQALATGGYDSILHWARARFQCRHKARRRNLAFASCSIVPLHRNDQTRIGDTALIPLSGARATVEQLTNHIRVLQTHSLTKLKSSRLHDDRNGWWSENSDGAKASPQVEARLPNLQATEGQGN
jgi:hypothetical protein